MVRARLRDHLENLRAAFPDELDHAEIVESANTDYACRIFMPKSVWTTIVVRLAEATDYDNFKKACAKQHGYASEYCDALHNTWDVMHRLQVDERR